MTETAPNKALQRRPRSKFLIGIGMPFTAPLNASVMPLNGFASVTEKNMTPKILAEIISVPDFAQRIAFAQKKV